MNTLRTLLEDVLDPMGNGLDSGCLHAACLEMDASIGAMPRYMGVGIRAVVNLLALIGYPAWSRPRRLRWLDRARHGSVGPLRDFVEFLEKMGTFTYFSRVEFLRDMPGKRTGAG